MKKILKSHFVAGVLILVVVCLGIMFEADVVIKEGELEAENINATETIEGKVFKTTGCTATGTKAVAFGYSTEASGDYSTAMGYDTEAIEFASTAMGFGTTAGGAATAMGVYTQASGAFSTAMGQSTTASGESSTAMGWSTTASGGYSTAMGYDTEASGYYSTAMGYYTTASGSPSTAMGFLTTASGACSTAIGSGAGASGSCSTAIGSGVGAGPASCTTAIGKIFINDVEDSFAVGFGQKDFSVESGLVKVHNNLYVEWDVDANTYSEHSTFYDKDTYGSALNYSEDSSRTIKLNAEGEKEYNHEADPVFLQKWVTVTDYNEYTEEEVWDDVLNKTITRRIYQTHQELRSNLSMKVAWLRQCVFELKQENQVLKDEIARLKEAVGIE